MGAVRQQIDHGELLGPSPDPGETKWQWFGHRFRLPHNIRQYMSYEIVGHSCVSKCDAETATLRALFSWPTPAGWLSLDPMQPL